MVDDSPVSRRVRSPSWLDLRLVAGIGLVLASVLVGAKVVSSADRTEQYWTAGHDLAAGVVLSASDLHQVAVRLPGGAADRAGGYVPAGTDLTGQALNRAIGAGELVPRSAVGVAAAATTLTIPIGGDSAPKISAGQRITVWVSTKTCPAVSVLSDVTVQSVQSARGGALDASGGQDVIVRVSPDLAQRVVEALAISGGVLRAGILDGASAGSTSLPDLSRCAPSGS